MEPYLILGQLFLYQIAYEHLSYKGFLDEYNYCFPYLLTAI